MFQPVMLLWVLVLARDGVLSGEKSLAAQMHRARFSSSRGVYRVGSRQAEDRCGKVWKIGRALPCVQAAAFLTIRRAVVRRAF